MAAQQPDGALVGAGHLNVATRVVHAHRKAGRQGIVHLEHKGKHAPIAGKHVSITGKHESITGKHVSITGKHVPITGKRVSITDNVSIKGKHTCMYL